MVRRTLQRWGFQAGFCTAEQEKKVLGEEPVHIVKVIQGHDSQETVLFLPFFCLFCFLL